ncbi:RHS repeat-associated core domain-containing protein [Singulisphaera acidiphila]|uniref:RHS repeat-associated core domain protein n=1 Tax=Singulisphaera acidiphila (strain ATCC BAA-1392 / DSM 18658 / VKM B-2454 / MOB10) TaxID=886293 RepID=L0DHL5_SINAD|nr:hypothetical protein [Singulisphaera acidiphila]AGA28340.1 hypothetical protein Sinac_4128 [Singulisphaera acidiphila DSM 18658]
MISTRTTGRGEMTLSGWDWDGSSLGRASLAGADPLGFAAGDTNLYRYVGNSPTNFTDPTGLQTVPGNYKPHPWPVPDPANTIVLIGPPKFKNGKPDPNDSNPFKRQVCRTAGIPDRNVFDYNGIQSLLDAAEKAKKLGLKKPHVVTWGHARPGGILVGVNPANGSFTDRFDKNSGADTLGNLLKSLGAKDYYNLGCNTFDYINASGPNGWDFFNAVQQAAGNIPIYGTVGYDMPGQNLDQAINGDPPSWYMEPGGHIVGHKPK